MKTDEAINAIKTHFPEGIVNETSCMEQFTLEIRKDYLKQILSFLKSSFEVLMDLTAVDYIRPHKRTKIIYWLHNPENLERVRLFVWVDRNEALPSVTDLWEGANWYERELYDLFGIPIEGHPHLTRILMPDDWVGHPLRRDYALTEVPVQFKHGVEPKIPSEIITHVKNNNARH